MARNSFHPSSKQIQRRNRLFRMQHIHRKGLITQEGSEESNHGMNFGFTPKFGKKLPKVIHIGLNRESSIANTPRARISRQEYDKITEEVKQARKQKSGKK